MPDMAYHNDSEEMKTKIRIKVKSRQDESRRLLLVECQVISEQLIKERLPTTRLLFEPEILAHTHKKTKKNMHKRRESSPHSARQKHLSCNPPCADPHDSTGTRELPFSQLSRAAIFACLGCIGSCARRVSARRRFRF